MKRRNKKFSRGYRKYIRFQKARIRGMVFDLQKRKELIDNLYKK
jgi:hypothetical protein